MNRETPLLLRPPCAAVEVASPDIGDVPRLAQGLELDLVLKRCLDVSVAATALFVLLPLMLLVVLAVRHDGGPALFRHTRLGRHGRPFACLKFRSMVVDADEALRRHLDRDAAARQEWAATQKLTHDPRVTRLGRMLRKSSLDELPQLINVLRGEMSLVGPRPIVPDEAARYGELFEPCFSVRPGVTGLWQVSGRSDCPYEERVRLDARYAREWSLAQDLAILIKTVPAVLAQRGSR